MHKAIWLGAAALWLLGAVSAWVDSRPPWVLPASYRLLEALLAVGGLLVVVATGYLAVTWRAISAAAAWRGGAIAGLQLAPLTIVGWLALTWLLGRVSLAPGLSPAGVLGRVLLALALGGGALSLLMAPLAALGGWLAGRR